MHITKKILLFYTLLLANSAYADLALSMNCHENITREDCKLLLIGAIDANHANNQYCPDGKTSYGFLISNWERDIKLYPQRKNLSTYDSMALTIKGLNLSCR